MTDVFFPEACQVVRKVGEEVSPDFEDCHKQGFSQNLELRQSQSVNKKEQKIQVRLYLFPGSSPEALVTMT